MNQTVCTYATIVRESLNNSTKTSEKVNSNTTKYGENQSKTMSTNVTKLTVDKNNFKERCQALKTKLTLIENPELNHRLNNATPEKPFLVGGLDLSLIGESQSEMICGYVIFSFKTPQSDPKLVYCDWLKHKTTVQYKAGYLGFREAEPMVKTVRNQIKKMPKLKPHVLLVDGNGILHPMGFGSACHIGVHLNIPTIGIGKKMHYFGSLQDLKDDYHNIKEKQLKTRLSMYKISENGQVLGVMMRSNELNKPIYVSQGYAISLKTSLDIVKKCLHKAHRRLPEPIFLADLYSRRKAAESNIVYLESQKSGSKMKFLDSQNKKFRKFLAQHYEMRPHEKVFWSKNLTKIMKDVEIRGFYNDIKEPKLAKKLGETSLRTNKSRKNSISSDSGYSGDEDQSTQTKIKSMQFTQRARTFCSKK